MAPKCAVVGAGPLGLMALKNLKEDGFDVTGYDAREYVGGLWNYSEDEYLSVQDSTIFNSSKYRSAITDFPFAEDVDDYPTWQQMHKYLDSYCDYFDLKRHIILNTKAVGLRREGEKWGLEVAPKGAEPRTDWYDKVVVSVGSFVKPKKPDVPGIELFKGTAIHAINYHHPQEYKDKRVLLVGLHATTQDVAVSLSKYASKAYASHKNGLVLACINNIKHKCRHFANSRLVPTIHSRPQNLRPSAKSQLLLLPGLHVILVPHPLQLGHRQSHPLHVEESIPRRPTRMEILPSTLHLSHPTTYRRRDLPPPPQRLRRTMRGDQTHHRPQNHRTNRRHHPARHRRHHLLHRLRHGRALPPRRIQPLPRNRPATHALPQPLPPPPGRISPQLPRHPRPSRRPLPRLRPTRTHQHGSLAGLAGQNKTPLLRRHAEMARWVSRLARGYDVSTEDEEHVLRLFPAVQRPHALVG